jgi:hypothetical protein
MAMLQIRRAWVVALAVVLTAGWLAAEEGASKRTPWTTSRLVGSPETPEP